MSLSMFIVVAIYLCNELYADSSRLLLQNACGNCGINPCFGCIGGQCAPMPGCCFTNNDCDVNQICSGRRCLEQVIAPRQWPWPCQRQFCECPANYDPVYCTNGLIYSNECASQCNCEINCFKICKSNAECNNIASSNGLCVDIPNDGCDPINGGIDCNGYCLGPMIAINPTTIGRPYNLDNEQMDLKAEFEQIDCTNYKFYSNDIQLITMNNTVSDETIHDWINKALSEHAAIATFSKFNLDLMSISAPLWFLETSTRASLDEIEHAKISFDILNMYIMNNNNNISHNKCIVYNAFPTHTIHIDADYNRISLDAAIGGCFGETLSAFKTYFDYSIDISIMRQYLNAIGMDEIRHSSLAWVAVKWIIDQRGDKIEVADIQWWRQQLLQRKIYLNNDNGIHKYGVETYVNEAVIPSILKLLWTNDSGWIETYDYSLLYNEINQLLENHLNIYSRKVLNKIDLPETVNVCVM